MANISQLVTVDKQQLTERVGVVPTKQLTAVLSGIDLLLGR